MLHFIDQLAPSQTAKGPEQAIETEVRAVVADEIKNQATVFPREEAQATSNLLLEKKCTLRRAK